MIELNELKGAFQQPRFMVLPPDFSIADPRSPYSVNSVAIFSSGYWVNYCS